jgi:hypothetical protein
MGLRGLTLDEKWGRIMGMVSLILPLVWGEERGSNPHTAPTETFTERSLSSSTEQVDTVLGVFQGLLHRPCRSFSNKTSVPCRDMTAQELSFVCLQ